MLAAALPIALVPLAGNELIQRGAAADLANGPSRFRYSRRLLIFVAVGLSAIGTSVLVQQTMCWLFRVPFSSTFGETFSYRMSYLEGMPEQERAAILARISANVSDPVLTEALQALDRSLNQGQKWNNLFLYYKIDEILLRSGFDEIQRRTWLIHVKLNRVALCVLFSGEPNFRNAVWTDFVLSPFFVQPDLAYPPFELTDWVQTQLRYPRYEKLRGLASFQRQEGFYQAAWMQIPYVHLFERLPMLEMACLTFALAIVFGGLALIGFYRDLITGAGAWYATAMIVVGLLVSFGTCLSTYFQGRLYLPVYALFQMGMLLAVSLAANVVLERLESFKNSR